MNKEQLLTQIYIKHPVFGDLSREAEDSFTHYNHSAALACLFVLLEGSLKYSLDYDETDKLSLSTAINKCYQTKKISVEEKELLHQIRRIRNSLFHDDPYSIAIVIDGLIYQYSETETKELLYEKYSPVVFGICARILQS